MRARVWLNWKMRSLLLNEAIGREEREAMAREHTTTSLEQEVERAERHMRVVGQDSAARRRRATRSREPQSAVRCWRLKLPKRRGKQRLTMSSELQHC